MKDVAQYCDTLWPTTAVEFSTQDDTILLSIKIPLSSSSTTNNNIFYIAPQQLYELLALYRSTNVIKHISICYNLKKITSLYLYIFQCSHIQD